MFSRRKRFDETVKINLNVWNKKIILCLEEKYLGEPDNSRIQITIRNNLSALYELNEENNKAIDELKVCLKLAIGRDYGHILAAILSAMAFNELKITRGEVSVNSDIILLSQKAYYIALARGDEKSAKTIKRFYRKKLEARNTH